MPIADLPCLQRIWGFSPLPFINGGRGTGRKNSRGGEKEGRKEGSAGANSFDPGIASRYLSAAS